MREAKPSASTCRKNVPLVEGRMSRADGRTGQLAVRPGWNLNHLIAASIRRRRCRGQRLNKEMSTRAQSSRKTQRPWSIINAVAIAHGPVRVAGGSASGANRRSVNRDRSKDVVRCLRPALRPTPDSVLSSSFRVDTCAYFYYFARPY